MSDPAQPPTPPATPPAQPQTWAAPGAAPFGPPAGAPAGAPVPNAAQPPAGWPAPPAGAYAPPPGYAAPVGYAAPGATSAPAFGAAPPAKRSATLGIIALVVAIVATAGASIFAAIASFSIGLGAGKGIATRPIDADFDWSILTPVRDWVLLGEVSFWVGTALGVWALIQGVIAIVTARGRGAGIAAVVVAALGPVAFGAVVQGFLTAGLAAGTGIGG